MSSLAGKLAELEKEVFELLQEKHTLTAEIDRLKGDNATLRTRLDALVTAVNEAIGIAENIRNLDPKIGADEIIDALAAAVREAKGEK